MFYKKVVQLETFPINICVIVSDDFEEVNEYLAKQGIDKEHLFESKDDLYATTIHGCIMSEDKKYGCRYVVLNPYNDYSSMTYGTICHEAVHVKNSIFRTTGMQPDVNNDENEAYLVGYLVDMIISFYLECRVKENFPLFKTKAFTLKLKEDEDIK